CSPSPASGCRSPNASLSRSPPRARASSTCASSATNSVTCSSTCPPSSLRRGRHDELEQRRGTPWSSAGLHPGGGLLGPGPDRGRRAPLQHAGLALVSLPGSPSTARYDRDVRERARTWPDLFARCCVAEPSLTPLRVAFRARRLASDEDLSPMCARTSGKRH